MKKKKLVLAAPRAELKLDLGCGQHPKEGFEGVDLYASQAKHKIDLFKFPWRDFKDNSVDEIYCSHFLEHIPAREIETRDLNDPKRTDFLGQDMLFAFMDECYRILKPHEWMHVVLSRSDSPTFLRSRNVGLLHGAMAPITRTRSLSRQV
jgi:predicted SAM-dependent methyltransferase